MQTQFLYPNNDKPLEYSIYNGTAVYRNISPQSAQSISDFTKSTSSSSGYYTYIDEGVVSPNDNDFIYISGLYQASGVTNPWGRNYVSFDVDNLSIYPSSVMLNMRCTYIPDNESGTMNVVAYLCNSGSFYTYDYMSGLQYVNGLNSQRIIASSIFTITSGTAFTNHISNMIINPVAASSLDKYHDMSLSLGYFYTPGNTVGYSPSRRNGLFKISALELVASGEYINTKSLPLEICGGDYLVRTDKLLIYHDYGNTGTVDNGVFQKLNPSDEVKSITYEYAHDLENKQSPLMCLNSGSLDRANIFNNCFFEFDNYSGTNTSVDFYSSKSSHKFNLSSSLAIGLSGAIYRGTSYSPDGNALSINGHYINEDSFVRFEPYMRGIISGCLPSGNFAMWIGASQFPISPSVDTPIITSESGDFSFGINANNRYYASLLNSSGLYTSVIATASNTYAQAIIVNYDLNGISLYKMGVEGSILKIAQSVPFNRYDYGTQSGNLLFKLTNSFNGSQNLNLNLYELGITNQGLSTNDLLQLSRNKLFESTHNNILNNISISSGSHHITYKSLEERTVYSGTEYSGNFFNFGRYQVGAGGYGSLIPSQFDGDMFDIAIQNKYGARYVDISENAFLSGTTNLFFQDGSLYFSGWIDAATTNPSGFLNNNLFVRVLQDKSKTYDIPDGYYEFGTPTTSSTTNYLSNVYPIEDGNYQDIVSTFTRTKSGGGGAPYYTSIDELRTSFSDADYIGLSGNTPRTSGIWGFKLTDTTDFVPTSCVTFFRGQTAYSLGANTQFQVNKIFVTNGSGAYPFSNNQIIASSIGTFQANLTTSFTHYSSIMEVNPSVGSYSNPYVYFIYDYYHVAGAGGFLNEGRISYINVEMSGNTVTTTQGSTNTEYYTRLIEAQGKVAAGTTTLRSGLNEYIFPLTNTLYRFDLYQNDNIPTIYKYVCYDKSAVEHVTWDGGDVSLYYATRNDPLNSGYFDTVKLYTSAIITESWSEPAERISGIMNLYSSGIGFSYSGVDLFACSNYGMSGTDLYLQAGAYNSGSIPLYIPGGFSAESIDLTLYNNVEQSVSGFALFTFASPYPSSENIINLYINSTTNSGMIANLDMMIRNSGFGVTAPLYLKGFEDEENADDITLVVWNNTTSNQYLDLFLSQNNSSIFDTQRLFIKGNGLYENAYLAQSGHTLTIGAGADPYSRPLYLTLNGPSGVTYSNHLFISGGNYQTKSLDLVIGSSIGKMNRGVSLYGHGF